MLMTSVKGDGSRLKERKAASEVRSVGLPSVPEHVFVTNAIKFSLSSRHHSTNLVQLFQSTSYSLYKPIKYFDATPLVPICCMSVKCSHLAWSH